MINENDIIKMKVKVPSKPLIWTTPHYYLCWNETSKKHSFLIFTSNYFKLFANNTCGINDISIIKQDITLPFTKTTYIVRSESYNINKIQEPNNIYKKSTAFSSNIFNGYKQDGYSAKQFNVNEYTIK